MPKIKINKFDGIYTNVDENDLRLDLFKDSVNFRHEQGYAKIELPLLSEYTLPDVNTYMSTTGWTWETGIYVNITNDPLNETPIPDKRQVLFLVAKKDISGTIHRLFWFKELPSGTWYELSAEGNYTNPTSMPSRTFFQTTKEGEVFFKEHKGTLKIYLPHDCFWFGLIDRTHYGTTRDITTLDQYYLDRLVEPFDVNNLGTDYDTLIVVGGLDIVYPYKPLNDTNRRLGWSTTLEIVETGSLAVKDEKVSFVYQQLESSIIGGWYAYKCTNIEDGSLIQTPDSNWVNSNYMHVLFKQNGADNILFHSSYDSKFKLQNGTAFATQYPTTAVNPSVDPGVNNLTGTYRVVSKATFDSDNTNTGFLYIGGKTVDDIGFANTYTHFDIIVTAVLDEQEEVIVYHNSMDFTSSNAKFVIALNDAFPTADGNFRLTRNRVYLKFVGEADFEMYKEYNYLNNEIEDIDTSNTPIFYLTEDDRTGVFLSQNIGFLIDEEKLEQYDVITNFKDIAVENGIGIGSSTDDYINVYYSAVGGGNIQTNLMYTANLLPLPQISFINALVGLNGNILAITDKVTHVIKPEEQLGVLAFQIIDTLEYGVKDFHDVASMESQIFLNTANGIFLTNGYDKKLISEPINDICKANYLTSRIDYNPVKHELYYTPNFGTSESFYRYRLDVNKWEPIMVSEEA